MLDGRRSLPEPGKPASCLLASPRQARSRSGSARRRGVGVRAVVPALALVTMLALTPGARTAELIAQDGVPGPVTLIHPEDGASVPVSRGSDIALAWRPQAPVNLWYFVEVVEVVSGERRDAFTGYTRQTALRVRLDDAGQYAWRVLAVNRASAHYSVSPWSSFTVGGSAR